MADGAKFGRYMSRKIRRTHAEYNAVMVWISWLVSAVALARTWRSGVGHDGLDRPYSVTFLNSTTQTKGLTTHDSAPLMEPQRCSNASFAVE